MPHLMLVAQPPPPLHGSNLMAEMALQALRHKGYSVDLVKREFSLILEEVGRFRLIKLWRYQRFLVSLITRSRKHRPELCIYFMAPNPPAVLADAFALRVLQKQGIPCVCYMHGLGFRTYDVHGSWWGRRIVRRALSESSGAIVVCEPLKIDLAHVMDSRRVVKVPNGLPDTPIRRHREETGKFNVLFLSNLLPSKGAHDLIRAVALLRGKTDAINVWVAGAVKDRQYAEELSELCKSLNLGDIVRFLGPVEGGDKDRLFAAADLFVLPTRNDTFGLVVLEALRAGLPVITTHQGSLPEMVRHGENGYLIDPDNVSELAEKLLTLLANEPLRLSMGRKGREIYESAYTYEKYADRLDAAVRQFLALAERGGQSQEGA